jgi:hypothetical protein
MLHMFAYAGAGIYYSIRLIRIANVYDAQSVPRRFWQTYKTVFFCGFFSGHIPCGNRKVSGKNFIDFVNYILDFLLRKIVFKVKIYFGLVGIDVSGKTAGASVAAYEYAA